MIKKPQPLLRKKVLSFEELEIEEYLRKSKRIILDENKFNKSNSKIPFLGLNEKSKSNKSLIKNKSHCVVIKISRQANSPNSMKDLEDMMKYFGREGFEIFDEDENVYEKEDIDVLLSKLFMSVEDDEFFQNAKKTFNKRSNSYENQSTVHVFKHIIFSYPHCHNKKDFQQVIDETLKNVFYKKYPYKPKYAFAVQDDTENMHAHVCLSLFDENGKRIKIDREITNELKRQFAKELNNQGYLDAYYEEVKISKIKTTVANERRGLKVLAFGVAPYKHGLSKSKSFFVKYQNKNGDVHEIWGAGLKDVIVDNFVQVGDIISLEKIANPNLNPLIKSKAVWKIDNHIRSKNSAYHKHFVHHLDTLLNKDYKLYFIDVYTPYKKLINSSDNNSVSYRKQLFLAEVGLRVGVKFNEEDYQKINTLLIKYNKSNNQDSLKEIQQVAEAHAFINKINRLKVDNNLDNKIIEIAISVYFKSMKYENIKDEQGLLDYLKENKKYIENDFNYTI